MPLWPVNQCTPFRSKIAVLRLVYPLPSGSGQAFTWRVFGSTRTIAFWPPSVSHGAPSAPATTPCGAEPGPSGTNSTLPLARDHAVRGGARAERHELHLAACRVEDAELAAALRREPHRPPGRCIGPDVVRSE